jgi:hypothetical protein
MGRVDVYSQPDAPDPVLQTELVRRGTAQAVLSLLTVLHPATPGASSLTCRSPRSR